MHEYRESAAQGSLDERRDWPSGRLNYSKRKDKVEAR